MAELRIPLVDSDDLVVNLNTEVLVVSPFSGSNFNSNLKDEELPQDAFNNGWNCTIEDLLDFPPSISDRDLYTRLKYKTFSLRSSQLQQKVHLFSLLPTSISHEIVSYELDENCIEIFVRKSLKETFLIKTYFGPSISGWILTIIGIYLFLTAVDLFHHFLPIKIYSYLFGNYSELGWNIELSVVLLLCSVHFICISVHYMFGRRNKLKINRIKQTLDFPEYPNCGEVYIPTLRWLGFPFHDVELFTLNWKWYLLLGFKYWIMVIIFIILCLPLYVLETFSIYIVLPPIIIICWIGSWLHLLTIHNRNVSQALKDLFKIAVMVGIVFSIIFGGIYVLSHSHSTYTTSTENQHKKDADFMHDLGSFNWNILSGNFSIFSVSLASMFVAVFLCIELYIIYSWKSINIRYHYFGWQLLASTILVIIFCILSLDLFLLISSITVMYNAAIIWNDLMHKKIMQITYKMNKIEYINMYRPIYNTDQDSEWITKSLFWWLCPMKCVKKCRGRWVINYYVGLITGRITKSKYL